MKYFLNTLLFTSVVLFTLGCIDEHEKKESLRKTIQQELTSKTKSTVRIAKSEDLKSNEALD